MKQILPAALCLASAVTSMAGTPQLSPESIVARNPRNTIAAPVMANSTATERPVIRKEGTEAGNESFDFTYAFEPYTALNLGANFIGLETYQGFLFTKEYADIYAGSTITSINVTGSVNDNTETNEITDVTVYLMESPDGNIFRTQKGTLSKEAMAMNSIVLDEPYTIEAGKSFFVCYSIVPKYSTDYYITVDAIPRANSDGFYVGYKNGDTYEWLQAADQVGNICMGITLESEKLPANGMNIFTWQSPDFVVPGEPFSVSVYLYNTAHNPVNTLEVEYTIGDAAPQSKEWSFTQPLPTNVMASGILSDLTCDQTGPAVPLKVRISKVNGEPNIGLEPGFETSFTCLKAEDGFKRTILAEEGTGTWCGWCPAGMVFMEHLRDQYPDEVIRVAIHAGSGSAEPMEVSSASSLISMFSGFPQVKLNRSTEITPTATDINQTFADYMEAERRKAAVAEISDISVEFLSATRISINAKTRFAIDMPNDLRYGVSFLITEDNVGPYPQTNYYAGGTNGVMGGWEKLGRTVPTIYDDVLRSCVGGNTGYTDVFPENIKGMTEYECTDDVAINTVTDSHFFVTALITDNYTGAVINSRQIEVVNSGVEGLTADEASVKVAGGNGCIMISGTYGTATVYDFGGVKMADANGSSMIELPAGLYIVTVDGTSHKVSVK